VVAGWQRPARPARAQEDVMRKWMARLVVATAVVGLATPALACEAMKQTTASTEQKQEKAQKQAKKAEKKVEKKAETVAQK
jgi:hypothetical protein